MCINMIMQLTCNFCDTQLLIPIRAAVTPEEMAGQMRQHGWSENADGKVLTHLCPLCVEVLDNTPPVEELPW